MLALLPVMHAGAQVVDQTSIFDNQNSDNMNLYFSGLCDRIGQSLDTALATPTTAQTDLLKACGAYSQGVSVNAFIESISPANFVSFKLDALLFSQIEIGNLMDRIQVLQHVNPLEGNVYDYSRNALGGGASADDANESSELLSKRSGLWFSANGSGGNKDITLLTGKLDDSQFAITGGMDYRFGSDTVLGGSLGYRDSKANFGDGGAQGNMKSKTLNVAIYFSSYLYKNLYLDAVLNYGHVKYDTQRNIVDLSLPPVPYTAMGSTNGNTLSGEIALGYEFAAGGWTITPSAHYAYADSKTDAFQDAGSGAFDLTYGEQHYHSSSARLDFNVSYVISGASSVWLPHLRTEWIKQFSANVDTFDVRFVNDADPASTPLPIQLDKLDDQYVRVSLGCSAQFHHDVSAYLDYQQLTGFDQVTFYNIAAGVRFQF